MRASEAFPSKYISAADLQGLPVTVKITHVTSEELNGKQKYICYFAGKKKGLVLNKTNWNSIVSISGQDDTDDWTGVEITLFEAMVDYQGKTVPGIRVRTPKPAPRVAAVDHERAPQRPVSRMTETNGQPSRQSTGADIDDTIPFAPEWR